MRERAFWSENETGLFFAVVTDSVNRATGFRFFALSDFIIRRRLLNHDGDAIVVVATEEIGSRSAAEIAIDALRVDIPFSGNISVGFLVFVCHSGFILFATARFWQ